ncbi:uncharacterized protein LOC110857631 isoform X2 [Folsomia candida]|uniref:uncharacterized protein LOC110857631 isoform X2 n=1 Tax=Folsomia candida TaxID=158441 RepID=UPI001604CD5E|nr:uncharacterized protein LOC110857631 isoform X2 [Folsomia candida]XP_035713906.1 uncharacterized protein LOC110857631 isoform X2 [Folsomia candida]XP_035713907.1 uncharacterized protein LOC110857631 isoform X2 [Folsomia candida]XP_035713909.1 uncharacterized protein LOC110857631 isoform X2 [Folsomia candida]
MANMDRLQRKIFGNSLILTKIISFLGFHDLQNLLLVSPSWDRKTIQTRLETLAIVHLSKKIIHLPPLLSKIVSIFKVSKRDYGTVSALWSRVSPRDKASKQWINNLPPIWSSYRVIHPWYLTPNHADKILHFFAQPDIQDRITFLRLTLWPEASLSFVHQLLGLLPNLQKLEIILNHFNVGQKLDEVKPNVCQNLKSFTICLLKTEQCAGRMAPEDLTMLCAALNMRAMHNVKSLQVRDCEGYRRESFLHYDDWQNLTHVDFDCSSHEMLTKLSLIPNLALKRLKLGYLDNFSLPLLHQILTTISGTLEILDIELATNEELDHIPSQFDFPTLPRLEKFSYSVGQISKALQIARYWDPTATLWAAVESFLLLDGLNMREIFKGGNATFTEKFPLLRNLELRQIEMYKNNCDIFFSRIKEGCVVFPRVKLFSLELPETWKNSAGLTRLKEKLTSFFPNVVEMHISP